MTENAPDLSLEAAEEAGLERWLKNDVTEERRIIWRVYNDAMMLSSKLKELLDSDNITAEEKTLVDKLQADLFWKAIELSSVFPGVITASLQIND